VDDSARDLPNRMGFALGVRLHARRPER
jgi:hypothetical protein